MEKIYVLTEPNETVESLKEYLDEELEALGFTWLEYLLPLETYEDALEYAELYLEDSDYQIFTYDGEKFEVVTQQ